MADEALSVQTAQAMRRRLVITLVAAAVLIGGGWITLWTAGGSRAVGAAGAFRRFRHDPATVGPTAGDHERASGHPAAGGRPIAGRARPTCSPAGGDEKAIRADRSVNRETRRLASNRSANIPVPSTHAAGPPPKSH